MGVSGTVALVLVLAGLAFYGLRPARTEVVYDDGPVITAPDTRETISGTSYDITGTADGVTFASYDLEIGSGREPS